MFIEAKDDGAGRDNWSCGSGIAPVKSPPPTHQHPDSGQKNKMLLSIQFSEIFLNITMGHRTGSLKDQ